MMNMNKKGVTKTIAGKERPLQLLGEENDLFEESPHQVFDEQMDTNNNLIPS